LFSGIGGLDLALEAFGHTPRWQAEIDPYARAVLARHWPGIHCFKDVREIDHEAPPVDIICGGSPCRNISNAGNREGIDGAKSVLWSEFARIVRVLRPGLVFFENVAAILGRGLVRVLGDLAACGYDAVWETFRASDVGAPHRRDRLFLLAYSDSERVRELRRWRGRASGCRATEFVDAGAGVANAMRGGQQAGERDLRARQSDVDRGGERELLADADGSGRERLGLGGLLDGERSPCGNDAHRCDCPSCYVHRWPPGPDKIQGWDGAKPAVRRSTIRLPGRIRRPDSLRLLGNSVVRQQAALALETLSARAAAEAARAA